MALLSFVESSTPSLQAQGEQRRSFFFNIPRDNSTKSTTIAQYKTQQLSISSNPKYLAFAERFRDGLRKAGMPEE